MSPAPTHGESHLSRSAGPGKVWSLCWCEEREVPVTADAVRRCSTESCGSLFCSPPPAYEEWSP